MTEINNKKRVAVTDGQDLAEKGCGNEGSRSNRCYCRC